MVTNVTKILTDGPHKLWSVKWKLDNDEDETWENFTITAQQMGLEHYFPNVTLHLWQTYRSGAQTYLTGHTLTTYISVDQATRSKKTCVWPS